MFSPLLALQAVERVVLEVTLKTKGKRNSPPILIYFLSVNRITNWKLGHLTGNIKFVENSFLEIGTTGYHFVYSQLFYCDGNTLFMGHYTFINNKSVMRSISSVTGKNRKYNTNYQGAVFLLTKGDRISVRIPFQKCYSMNRETSYFGAFLITPVVNVTDSPTT